MSVDPGALVDCKNYEVVDTSGYKRIDGFERFDGRESPSQYGVYILTVSGGPGFVWGNTNLEDSVAVGDRLFSQSGSFPFGTMVRVREFAYNSGTIEFIAQVADDSPYWPQPGEDIYIANNTYGVSILHDMDTGYPTFLDFTTFTDAQLEAAGFTSEFLIDQLNASYALQRDEVTRLSWGARPHGLQWFNDRLYAVADCESMYFNTTAAVTGEILYPGETLVFSGGATAEIVDYRLVEGSLAASGAILKLLVRRLDSTAIANGETVTTARITGSPLTYTTAPVLSSGVEDPPTWGAALYRSTSDEQATAEGLDAGWNPVDMGLEVDFTGATTSSPPDELSRENYDQTTTAAPTPSSIAAAQTAVVLASTPNTSFVVSPSGTVAAAIAAQDSAHLRLTSAGSGTWAGGGHSGLGLTGFDASVVPEDAYITGIEVKLSGRTRDSGGGDPGASATVAVPQLLLKGFEGSSANRGAPTITFNKDTSTLTFGSATDRWNLGAQLNRSNIILLDWGIEANFVAANPGVASGDYLELDKVEIVLHYIPSTTKLYFHDGTNEVSADVVRINVRSGIDANSTYPDYEWVSATGTMHVYNVQNTIGTKDYIAPGDTMDLATGAGTTFGTVSGVRGSMLPTLAETVANGVRYEFIKANFYANENWEALYGVSGSSHAFAYDGTYFRKIYTGYEPSNDKPRHLAFYRNYLALGFPTGSVLLSALGADGPEPENFDPNSTSTSWNFNDKVFALHSLPDTSLGVFCESSIQRLVLDGSGDIIQSYISPNSGVLEYTVAPVGPTVMFCDNRGIRDLAQVDVYGDFVGKPLSQKLGSWLRSRLSKLQPYTGAQSLKRVIAAYAVRNKNQYRLWFSDGQQLTMTLLGNEQEPIFTFQQFSDGTQYYCPIAISSGVDQFGRERIHFSHYCTLSEPLDSINSDTDKRYVFEMDKGWFFDDNVIDGYIDTTFNFLDNPVQVATLNKVRLYGTSVGSAVLTVQTRNEFNDTFSTTAVDISLPRGTVYGLPTDPKFYKNIANVSERGEVIGLRFSHEPEEGRPPHTLQSLVLDFKEGKNAT